MSGVVLFCRDQGLFTARLVARLEVPAAASAKRIIGRREIAQEAAHLLKPAAACTIIAASFSCQSFRWNFA
jgi:hypothetical protein